MGTLAWHRIPDRVERAEIFRQYGDARTSARVVVRGRRDKVSELRDRPAPPRVELKVSKADRRRGTAAGVVPWDRVRACHPRGLCGISVCPRCGVGARRRAVVGRAHALACLARDWGGELSMVTLTAPWTTTGAEARTRKRAASAVFSALTATGRFVVEMKNKDGRGPDCCREAACGVCGGLGYMPKQHLHCHGLVVLDKGRWDYSRLHEVVRAHYEELGWWSVRFDRQIKSPSHAAGYLAAYAAKIGDDPWQWARLRLLLGARWGETWGALRGLEKSVSVQVDNGGRIFVHHVGSAPAPRFDPRPDAFAARLQGKLREFRRVPGLVNFHRPEGT